MQLQVSHLTRYDYLPAVETAQHMAYLKPPNTPDQQLLSHELKVEPAPAQTRWTQDVFGNARCFFSLQVPHTVLEVFVQSTLSTQGSEPPASSISWEKTRDLFRYRSGEAFDAANEFVFASPFVPRHAEFAAYARASFTPAASVLEVAIDLMRRIHTDFIYESQSTEVNTPAQVALAQRKGVCQDFAHIMIACLRVMGIPARYVSGYLLTQPAPGSTKLKGSDASHAWVAVYVPDLPDGARWCDLDPTNNRWGWHSPGPDYVRLATGRDFFDVSPIRGVIHGGASHTLLVAVTVEESPMQDLAIQAAASQLQSQTQSQSQGQGQGQSQSQSQRFSG
jgi:transglutaminase-like putative cysteine protease